MLVKIHKGVSPLNVLATDEIHELGTLASNEEVLQQIKEWEEAVISVEQKDENLLWIGNLNVKVKNDLKQIEGNWEELADDKNNWGN